MHIVVLGAGVIGVTTAYFLAQSGHQVTVLERQQSSGKECSFANGGQLSYSHVEPWANPSAIRNIIKWLGKEDAPLIFRLRLDVQEWIWGMRFLMNCRPSKSHTSTRHLLGLSLHSKAVLNDVLATEDFSFSYQRKGVLHIFRHAREMEAEITQATYQKTLGCDFKVLNKSECFAMEPSLREAGEDIIGGVWFPLDESGDIYTFTEQLSKRCMALGVTFAYGTDIRALLTSGNTISGVETARETIKADAYIMAMGAYSPLYLSPIGIEVPIYPMKGYSISFPVGESSSVPHISLTDQCHKIVYSRLGNILRVAGTAEFAGYNPALLPARLAPIRRAATTLFPSLNTEEILQNTTEWACLRPSTPDGIPVLGETAYRNLYLNTGHGTLGWTLACGSADLLTKLINKETLPIPLDGMTVARFRRLRRIFYAK